MKSQEDSAPVRHRQSSLYSLASLNQDSQKASSHTYDQFVNDLYSKFLTVSSQVNIEHDISAFNMAEYDRSEKKIKYDRQLQLAKLKHLQNKAELKRADLELEQRRKRLFRFKKNDEEVLPLRNHYLNTYKKLKEDAALQNLEDDYRSDSEDEKSGRERGDARGINYYQELKRHPKILKYTIDRVKSKEVTELQQQTSRTMKLQNYRNQIKAIVHGKPDLTERSNRNRSIDVINPEKVVDSIFRKIYSKKGKELSAVEVKKNLRLSRFIEKQDEILSSIEERSLSKDNQKRLKGKLEEIVNEMYQNDRKHKNKLLLPRISLYNIIDVAGSKRS